jgi:RTX calcium-binding nonapeptide repeat (4 copies)/WD40-like Beta Propeller Repeat
LRRSTLLAAAAALTALAAALPASSARSAFPGRNGELVFTIVLPVGSQGMFGYVKQIQPHLCVVDPSGGTRRWITYGFDPAWSADGGRLAYAFDRDRFGARISTVRADGGAWSPLSGTDPNNRSPSWSPDGARVAFRTRGGIAVAPLDGAARGGAVISGHDPAWSPDGRAIAFVGAGGQLALARPDGSEPSVLTSGPTRAVSPDWAPDGTRLVFAAYVPDSPAAPTLDVLEVETGARRTLLVLERRPGDRTAERIAGLAEPTWSPDGTAIAFVDRPVGDWATDVFVIPAGGGAARNVTRSPFAEWGIDWRAVPTGGAPRAGRDSSCGLSGSADGDRIAGTPDDDYVESGGGNDVLVLGLGADMALAGPGDDRLVGGPTRSAYRDSDALFGQGGDDTLLGGDGADELAGGSGRDRIFGGRGDDVVGLEHPMAGATGGPGDDLVDGGPGADVLYGGPGNDRLVGGAGRDHQIYGGAGDDVILARDGARDRVDCASGRDRVEADRFDRVGRNCEVVRRR